MSVHLWSEFDRFYKPAMKQAQLLLRFIWAVLAVFNGYSKAGENMLVSPSNIQCACSNEELLFNCTVIVDGGGVTIWTGTAFSCDGNEILLRHNNFNRTEGTSGECSGDASISAKSVKVEGNCYTSQLSVTPNAGLNNRTVLCVNNGMTTIGTSTIFLTTGPYQRAPAGINLISAHPGELTFNWSHLDPSCPSVQYVINSDCGNCSVSGDRSATCSNLQLSATERNCTFSVGSVICGFNGPSSDPVTVTLKVPDAPQVNFIPVYSNESQLLVKLIVEISKMGSFLIYEGISGSVVNYTVHFSSGANRTRSANCTANICEYTVEVPPTECQSSSDDSMVCVSAANRLGLGQSSEPISVGCTNEFVTVEIDSTTSTLTCRFQNNLNTVEKTCSAVYSLCNQEDIFTTMGNSTSEFPNQVTLQIPSGSDCYTYTIRASDGTSSVMVQGRVDPGKRHSNSSTVVVAVVVVTLVILAIIAITAILLVVLFYRKRVCIRVTQNDAEGVHIEADVANAPESDNESNLEGPTAYPGISVIGLSSVLEDFTGY